MQDKIIFVPCVVYSDVELFRKKKHKKTQHFNFCLF